MSKKRLFPYEERTIPRLSTLLDPRMKKEAFQSSENANIAISLLKSEMCNTLHKNTEGLLNNDNSHEENEDQITSNSTSSTSLFSFMTEHIEAKKKGRTQTVDSIIVLPQYLERPNTNSDMDPLLFWKVIIKILLLTYTLF